MSRISRRSLLTSGAAAGVLAASGMALAAVPKSGGTLKAALGGGSLTDNWDARGHSGLFMMAASHGAVFDCLTEIGADGALHGELAHSWDASSDARIWTFNLRKEVLFHNGKSFGAEDVVESFALHMGQGNRSPAAPLLRAVKDIKVLSPHQIQFELAAPNADFPYLLADYHLVIYPAGYVELAFERGIGTGLYRVAHFDPGVRLVATRVASHYKDTRAGFFAELEFVHMGQAADRSQAVLNADVAVASQLSPIWARDMGTESKVRVQRVSGNQHFGFTLAPNVAPDARADLLLALKHGVNRTAILDEALFGFGHLGSDTPIGPANHYFAADLEPLAYDPDRARFHLKKAGMRSVALTAAHGHIEQAGCGAAMFECQLADIGLGVQSAVSERGTQSQLNLQTSAGRATEDWAFSTYYASGAAWNLSDWTDSQFQSALLAARSEMETSQRRAHYHDMQRMLRDRGPTVVPVFVDHVQAVAKAITCPPTIGNQWAMDNARFAERWWQS